MLVLQKDFDNAVTELIVLIQTAKAECIEKGFNFWPAKFGDAPETFEELKNHGKLLPVASYGCETAIYGSDVNIDFRFWHDVLHIELNEGFSTASENAVADAHIEYARSHGCSKLAINILIADTKGQIAYYHRHKEFVNNQTAFVQTVLRRSLDVALLMTM